MSGVDKGSASAIWAEYTKHHLAATIVQRWDSTKQGSSLAPYFDEVPSGHTIHFLLHLSFLPRRRRFLLATLFPTVDRRLLMAVQQQAPVSSMDCWRNWMRAASA